MKYGFLETTRLVDLYRNHWLFRLPSTFLEVYLISPFVYCTNEEVCTFDEEQNLYSFSDQPAVIYNTGDAEWWNKRGNYRLCTGYIGWVLNDYDIIKS